MSDEPLADFLRREHGRLDELLGRFFGAAHAGSLEAAREALAVFDDALRQHTAHEEERILPPVSGRKLLPGEEESARGRLGRELRLEHVQIRELSAMMRRLLEQGDLQGAARLAASLARRWDAHTAREEQALADSDSSVDA
ncbi:MAG TPA: hemerythrin domain-containing protein [Thermoanaerobaculia bacterium]|jgi:hypothetical protein